MIFQKKMKSVSIFIIDNTVTVADGGSHHYIASYSASFKCIDNKDPR